MPLQVPRPDGKPDNLGLLVLDEPSTKQSDPTVLSLWLTENSKQHNITVSQGWGGHAGCSWLKQNWSRLVELCSLWCQRLLVFCLPATLLAAEISWCNAGWLMGSK